MTAEELSQLEALTARARAQATQNAQMSRENKELREKLAVTGGNGAEAVNTILQAIQPYAALYPREYGEVWFAYAARVVSLQRSANLELVKALETAEKEIAELHGKLEYAERVAKSWREAAKGDLEPAILHKAAKAAMECAKNFGAPLLADQLRDAITGLANVQYQNRNGANDGTAV